MLFHIQLLRNNNVIKFKGRKSDQTMLIIVKPEQTQPNKNLQILVKLVRLDDKIWWVLTNMMSRKPYFW